MIKVMNESYFIPTVKVNSKISELVIPGHYIEIENYRYEKLIRKPRGRSISRRLLNTSTNERFIIYT